jgi:hypothetical protein
MRNLTHILYIKPQALTYLSIYCPIEEGPSRVGIVITNILDKILPGQKHIILQELKEI